MITVDEKTTIVGVAELRDKTQEVLKEAKTHKVILTKRNKPVGVLVDYDEYKRIKEMEEELEDMALSYVALQRSRRKSRRTVSLEAVEKRVGLR